MLDLQARADGAGGGMNAPTALSPTGGSTNVVTHDRTDVQSPALISPVEGGSMEEGAGKAQIPAGAGRAVQVRPCHAGNGVQLAVLSTRGNIMEAVTLDASQLAGLLGALKQAQVDADAEADAVQARNAIRRKASYEAALARNPHLNGSRPLGSDKYIVRPR